MMINQTEAHVLKTLVHEHAMPALQLAIATQTPVSTMMSLIESLESRGFLRRKDAASRSGGVVIATTKGEQEVQKVIEEAPI